MGKKISMKNHTIKYKHCLENVLKELLEWSCLFQFCEGPDAKITPQQTCCRCYLIKEIRKTLDIKREKKLNHGN